MFKFLSQTEQLIEERKKRLVLQAKQEKAAADIEYLAMMADIDLDEDEDSEVDKNDAQ